MIPRLSPPALRLYKDEAHFEVEWTVGPVPVADGQGKEVVLEYRSTAIRSGRDFSTDSNGRHMMRRVRDRRPGWRLNVTEPVAGNFYPVTAAAMIQDSEHSLAVLVDRAQGVWRWRGAVGKGEGKWSGERVEDRRVGAEKRVQ